MSTITLREYHQFIDNLIEKNANSEAIFHCTNILSSFPKSIKTYQQLGQALLEKQRYSDASEVFSKVLTVLPDDFISHAGLSAVHEENRELDKAIWHMEQAFETQPSNATIQEEFRRLISRRDGTAPSKIRLTRGALIRMYAKGELYQQAIAETQSALQTDPERIDLKLLLARMLVLTNSNTEAAEICVEILKENPYCFEANRIMFELNSTTSDPDEIDPIFLQRLSELDPYYSFLETVSVNVNDIPADKITLEKPEFTSLEEDFSLTPQWVNRIGISWDEGHENISEIDNESLSLDEPDNETLTEDTLQATPFIDGISEIPAEQHRTETSAISEAENDLPDWISKAGWTRASETEAPSATPEPSEEALFQESGPDNAVGEENLAQPAEDLPEWLKTIKPFGTDSPQIFASSDEEPITEAKIPPLPPEMISEFLSENDDQSIEMDLTSSVLSDNSENNLPDFLPPTPSLASAPGEETIPDLPDWLKDLDTGEFIIAEPTPETSIPVISELATSSEEMNLESVPDFIEELGSTDLVGEIEPLPDEIIVQEQISPIGIDELEQITLSSETIEHPEISSTREPDEILEPRPLELKPTIPSWVKNILSSSETSTPTISPVPSAGTLEQITVTPSDTDVKEELIEELITDLPGINAGKGVISAEVTEELESWLDDIKPDKTPQEVIQSISEDNLSLEKVISEIPTEISLESLLDQKSDAEIPAPVSEIESEFIPEEESVSVSDFEDRLSSMMGVEEKTTTAAEPAQVLESEIPAIKKPEIEKVIDLLKSGDYASYVEEVSKVELPVEDSDRVIFELDNALKVQPDNYKLWQNLGDIENSRANFSDALNAYHEAEKQILF